MGWEYRGKRKYYYEKRWIDGTCKSEYVRYGSIPADLCEATDLLERYEHDQKAFNRDLDRLEQDRQTKLDRQLEQFYKAVRQITRTVLETTGYHRHKGQWRKRRMSQETKEQRLERLNRANDLLQRVDTERPAKKDLEAFRSALEQAPEFVRVMDLAGQAADYLISEIKGSQAVREVYKARYELVLKDLGYKDASPLEQLLIWQVALSWLRLGFAERQYTGVTMGEASYQRVHYWERRLSATQSRYLRAVETLAKIRRLASKTPEILQVNIATNQQVNVNP